jgi:lipid-A-disaccharide synthase-like uncharacterized protein
MIITKPFFNANTTRKWLDKHVAGVAAWELLGCFSGLLLLVRFLGEDVSAVNPG